MDAYGKLINNEKKLNTNFLLSECILDYRFDENEYSLLKKIFEKEKLIKKIFEIIDILVNEEKLELESRYLIMADFIFSITFNSTRDNAYLALKITRNDYINKIKVRAEINTVFGYDYYQYIKIHKKLLIGLRIEKVLERSIIRLKNSD